MDEFAPQTTLAEYLESQSDDELRNVIDQAKAILKAHESECKRLAVAEIRRIAKEIGVDVAISKKSCKSGRPRKSGTGPG